MKWIINIWLLLVSFNVFSEVLVDIIPRNQFVASVNTSVFQDPRTHAYKYSYELRNDSASIQSIDDFVIPLGPRTKVFDIKTMEGWEHLRYTWADYYSFSAVSGITAEDVEYLQNGAFFINSKFDVEPGNTICCFSFWTLTPPQDTEVFLRGAIPQPQAESEEDEFNLSYDTSLENDSFKFLTKAPIQQEYDGNRRPAVDGFVAAININTSNRDEFTTPATIFVDFSLNDENVDELSFVAVLNGVDVTNLFLEQPENISDIYSIFDLNTSPIQVGKNVLKISVDGVVPDSKNDQYAKDTDSYTFTVY